MTRKLWSSTPKRVSVRTTPMPVKAPAKSATVEILSVLSCTVSVLEEARPARTATALGVRITHIVLFEWRKSESSK